MGDFRKCYEFTAKEEGGYVNHPKDPGGATNRGITQKTYDGYRLRTRKGKRSVRLITDDEVHAIYKEQYWDPIKGDSLPEGIDLVTYDFAVNSGVSRAVRHLQAALGVKPDGIVGNQTLGAAREAERLDKELDVILKVQKSRLAFLKGLNTWKTFGKGWGRRVARGRDAAIRMEALADAARDRATKIVKREDLTTDYVSLYDPDAKHEPESVVKAGLNSMWSGIAAGAGGLLSLLPEALHLLSGTRNALEDMGLPVTIISGALLGVAVAFAISAYNRSKEQDDAETPPAQEAL